MDTILFYQRYEFYLTRVSAMLAEAHLIWFHFEGLNTEMIGEPYNSSVISVVLTTIMDFQCRGFTDSLLQWHDIVLLDEKPGTVDFRNGFARPVGEMFAEGNIGEEGFTTRALV